MKRVKHRNLTYGPKRSEEPRGHSGHRAHQAKPPGLLRDRIAVDELDRRLRAILFDKPASRVLLDSYLSKYDDQDPASAEARRNRALKKYFDCESRNRATNGRLSPRPTPMKEWDCVGILHSAQLKIARVLPAVRWSLLDKHFAFGPGATRQLNRRKSDVFWKLQEIEVSTSAVPMLAAALAERDGWTKLMLQHNRKVKTVDTGHIINVPKNSEVDRIICIEPSGNMFLQKGVGTVIRKALKRVGINLDDQKPNQEAARYGSLMGNLATVDLSAASDSISYWLVRRLIPSDWFSVMEATRTRSAMLDGRIVKMQKFSAMGNGFTFELESLIFWALSSAVIDALALRDRTLCVYGDDIVINVDAVPLLTTVFEYCGFSVNAKKTFTDGPFRESCGAYWHEGNDVKPFYLRKPVHDHETLFLLHNNLLRWVDTHPECVVGGCSVASFLDWLRSHADVRWRSPRIPLWGYGDGAFASKDRSECAHVHPAPGGQEGWVVPVLSSRPGSRKRSTDWCLLSSLYDLERRGSLDVLTPPSPPRGVREGSVRPCVLRIRVAHW